MPAAILQIEPRLHVADVPASVAFYARILGFRVDALFPEERPTFALLSWGTDEVRLQLGGAEGQKARELPSSSTLYLRVQDALAWHERLQALVPIEWGPEVYFYHRREFAIRDPDGHLVIFSEETDDPITTRDE
jgi:catechol 2,3-dioxygenase-like lactoylglutathione lyase family enzyme